MTQFDERDLFTGLAALHWATISETDSRWDQAFYKRIIEEGDGPALELGCGAGRLLIAYLQEGLDVDGVDISGDMLAVCREHAAAAGVAPTLYEQPMQELDVPGRYRTIYIPCGSFVVVMDREEALETLRRCYAHLQPAGTLAFNVFLPDDDYFEGGDFPRPWQKKALKELDGNRRLRIDFRLTGADPIEQFWMEERRYRLYDGDELLQEEIHTGQGRWYTRNELLWMLRLAGFAGVQVKGDYSDEPFGSRHEATMVFLATRPADGPREALFSRPKGKMVNKTEREQIMNPASRWRYALARRVAPVYAANPHVAAVILGGSTARGHADRYSDVELGVFWRRPPTDTDRKAAADAINGDLVRLYPYDPAEEVWCNDYMLEVVHYTVDFLDRTLDAVLRQYDPAPLKQNLIAGVVDGAPMHNAALIQEWQSRAAPYPDGLARAVVKRHAQIDHFWRWEMWLARSGNLMMLYQVFTQVQQQLLHVLLGLNRVYYFGFKWLDVIAARLAHKPPDLVGRLRGVYQVEPAAGAQKLATLVEETYDLIETHLPEIDVARLRDLFRYRRPVWEQAPPYGKET